MVTDNSNKNMGFLIGNEPFMDGEKPLEFTVNDFWSFQFSNLWDMQGEVGEFVVSMALGNAEPDNKCGWTLYDIDYNGKRIEVKTTAYYQPWRERSEKFKGKPLSQQRSFSIRKAHEKEQDMTSPLVRNNDVYVFCLILGETREASNPLILDHWRFWVIPTKLINAKCGDNKSITLPRVKKLFKEVFGSEEGLRFANLKSAVDKAIEYSKK